MDLKEIGSPFLFKNRIDSRALSRTIGFRLTKWWVTMPTKDPGRDPQAEDPVHALRLLDAELQAAKAISTVGRLLKEYNIPTQNRSGQAARRMGRQCYSPAPYQAYGAVSQGCAVGADR